MTNSDERDFSEYEFDANVKEAHGYQVGDMISVIEDDPDEGYGVGEEGVVVGFSVIPAAENPHLALAFGNDPHERTAMYVLMDGTTEPIEVKPAHIEAA